MTGRIDGATRLCRMNNHDNNFPVVHVIWAIVAITAIITVGAIYGRANMIFLDTFNIRILDTDQDESTLGKSISHSIKTLMRHQMI